MLVWVFCDKESIKKIEDSVYFEGSDNIPRLGKISLPGIRDRYQIKLPNGEERSTCPMLGFVQVYDDTRSAIGAHALLNHVDTFTEYWSIDLEKNVLVELWMEPDDIICGYSAASDGKTIPADNVPEFMREHPTEGVCVLMKCFHNFQITAVRKFSPVKAATCAKAWEVESVYVSDRLLPTFIEKLYVGVSRGGTSIPLTKSLLRTMIPLSKRGVDNTIYALGMDGFYGDMSIGDVFSICNDTACYRISQYISKDEIKNKTCIRKTVKEVVGNSLFMHAAPGSNVNRTKGGSKC